MIIDIPVAILDTPRKPTGGLPKIPQTGFSSRFFTRKYYCAFQIVWKRGRKLKPTTDFLKTYLVIKEYFVRLQQQFMENSEALANLAAAYEVPDSLVASLQVFKGDDSSSRRQRHTDAESDRLPLILSQGFVVMQAVIHRHLQLTLNNRYSLSEASSLVVKVKPSTVASQGVASILACFVNKDELFWEGVERLQLEIKFPELRRHALSRSLFQYLS